MTEIYVAIAVQLIGFVVWIARLDTSLKNLRESFQDFKSLHERTEFAAVDNLKEIAKAISEIRTDIKWIISTHFDKTKGDDNVPSA